jgi:hypothetical protein
METIERARARWQASRLRSQQEKELHLAENVIMYAPL